MRGVPFDRGMPLMGFLAEAMLVCVNTLRAHAVEGHQFLYDPNVPRRMRSELCSAAHIQTRRQFGTGKRIYLQV